MNILDFIVEHLDTIMILPITALLMWDKFMSGSSKIRKEIAEDYKERNSQLEAKILDLTHKLDATNLLVAELKGILIEKENQLKTLTEILANRNPELEKVLTDIRNFMQSINTINAGQSKMLEKQEERAIKKEEQETKK